MVTQEYLKSILHYDPVTGIFTWIAHHFKNLIGRRAGTVQKTGYRTISIGNKQYKEHRLAFLYMTGKWPENDMDHKNGVRYKNNWDNLREATRQENMQNRKNAINNKSGYKGVSIEHGKWVAYISINKIQTRIGMFDTPEEADAAYKAAAKIHYGEFVREYEYE